MIKITDSIWIGNSMDEWRGDLRIANVQAILNVAQDLQCTRGWRTGTEYMQVGLIDGPGNPECAYHAAVLALAALVKRSNVLVCCHSGGRALAVVLMYLRASNGDYKRTWEEWLSLLKERIEGDLPDVRPEHREMLGRIDINLHLM